MLFYEFYKEHNVLFYDHIYSFMGLVTLLTVII